MSGKKGDKAKGGARRRAEKRPGAGVWTRFVFSVLCPTTVAVAAFMAFWPALDAGFVDYDDDALYIQNTGYQGLDASRLRWMFTTKLMGHYQPLTWLSVALDHTISGADPSSYHRTNLVLHALAALVLYFVAKRLLTAAHGFKSGEHPFGLRLAAAAAALLFAIHPLRVESVAWISERRDVLSLLFLLLTLAAYLRAFVRGRADVHSRAWYAASWLLLLCSLLAKAWGMSFVIVAIILDVYPLRRLPGKLTHRWGPATRPVWHQKLPYLILGLAAAAMASQAQHSGTAQTMKTLAEWGIVERITQACYGLMFYLWKTVWPTQLAALYELPYRMNPLEARFIAGYVFVAVAILLIVWLRRRVPAVVAAALAYLVILAPVLGFAQTGPQLVADKYAYVSCVGWSVLASGGLLWIWRRGHRTWKLSTGVATGAVLVILFVLTYRQTVVWHDSESLWTHAIAVGHPSSAAHLSCGHLAGRENRLDDAIAHYRAALDLKPDYGYAWLSLGNKLYTKRRLAEAEEAYRQAAHHMVEKHSPYIMLGQVHFDMGRLDDAIASFRMAVQYVDPPGSPDFNPHPYLLLGSALRNKGEFAEARQMLEIARQHPKTQSEAETELSWMPPGRVDPR